MRNNNTARTYEERMDRMFSAPCLLLKRLQSMPTPNLESTMSTVLKSEIVSLGKSSIYSTSENITSTPNPTMSNPTMSNPTMSNPTMSNSTMANATELQSDKPTENPNKYSKERHYRMKHIAENDKVIRSFDNFCKKHKCGAQRSLLRGAMYMKSVQF